MDKDVVIYMMIFVFEFVNLDKFFLKVVGVVGIGSCSRELSVYLFLYLWIFGVVFKFGLDFNVFGYGVRVGCGFWIDVFDYNIFGNN